MLSPVAYSGMLGGYGTAAKYRSLVAQRRAQTSPPGVMASCVVAPAVVRVVGAVRVRANGIGAADPRVKEP